MKIHLKMSLIEICWTSSIKLLSKSVHFVFRTKQICLTIEFVVMGLRVRFTDNKLDDPRIFCWIDCSIVFLVIRRCCLFLSSQIA